MKITVLYYEIKEKNFRSLKTLNKFLDKTPLEHIIYGNQELKGVNYRLWLNENKKFCGIKEKL